MVQVKGAQGLNPLRWLARLGRHELGMLVVLLLALGGVWAFAEIADEVMEGEALEFDERLLLALRDPVDRGFPLGPDWMVEMGRDFSGLGGLGVLALLTVAAAGFLWLQRKGRAVLLLLVAVGGGVAISLALKYGFDRPRPDLVPHGSYVYTKSFPSGHSMMSAVTYLTLGALLVRFQERRAIKAYILIVAILLTLCVGTSRVYLGVHWPTDVLAAWALGCWLVARAMQRRGTVEQETPEPEALTADGPTAEEKGTGV